jgi:transposase
MTCSTGCLRGIAGRSAPSRGSGRTRVDELSLPQPYALKVASLRKLIAELGTEIALLDAVIADLLAGRDGYRAIQALPRIGSVLAAVIVAEIGDIRRFSCPAKLCCRAGLTPRHRPAGLFMGKFF